MRWEEGTQWWPFLSQTFEPTFYEGPTIPSNSVVQNAVANHPYESWPSLSLGKLAGSCVPVACGTLLMRQLQIFNAGHVYAALVAHLSSLLKRGTK